MGAGVKLALSLERERDERSRESLGQSVRARQYTQEYPCLASAVSQRSLLGLCCSTSCHCRGHVPESSPQYPPPHPPSFKQVKLKTPAGAQEERGGRERENLMYSRRSLESSSSRFPGDSVELLCLGTPLVTGSH